MTLAAAERTDGSVDLNAFAKSLGIDFYAFGVTRLPGFLDDPLIATARTNYPSEWVERYVLRSYRFYDPAALTADHSRLPFRWGQGDFLSAFDKSQRIVFHEAREFGIAEGYCVPLAGPDGETAMLNFAGPSLAVIDDIVASRAAEIQLLAVRVFDEAVRGLQGRWNRRPLSLKSREKQCLLLTSQGMTAEAAAQRLGVSVSSVNHHLAAATRTLGAQNKHHAAIIALRERWI